MSAPKRLGRYSLEKQVGRGGMGVVYLATVEGSEGFSKRVAVKMISDALAEDPGIRAAFESEAATAQRLHHGNIVQILDLGSEGGRPYMVLEYVEGASLAEILGARHGKPLPIAAAFCVAESVAAALAYAHGLTSDSGRDESIVHRDITPRNILLSSDGVVKLADFGLARALAAPSYTLPGTVKGSLGYLAPEQARGEAVDARADQFSLGVVIHEMLAGEHPLRCADLEEYRRLLEDGLPRLAEKCEVDAALGDIVARATAVSPGDRYPAVEDLLHELEAWRVKRQIRTSPEELRKSVRMMRGEEATLPARRPLFDALGGGIAAEESKDATVLQRPPLRRSPPERKQSWALPLALASTALVGLLVLALLGRNSGPRGAQAADAAPVATSTAPDVDASPPRRADAGAQDASTADAAAPDVRSRRARPVATPRPTRRGRLKVNVIPWARVSIDGRALSRVPVDTELPAGRHRLLLENPDTGQRAERWIVIEPETTLEIIEWPAPR